ncbi:TRAP transporter TatT component family protein [Bacteriovoracaceae bacterium]|nr:TRAP transporter TatT component family protein [Bacteriovoracaceae bacterium]
MGKNFSLIISIFFLASCSTIKKVGISTTSSIIYESHDQSLLERDWDYFEESSLANLKFVESIHSVDPDNEEILFVLTKGFSGYAYAVYETKDLFEVLAEKEVRPNRTRAIAFYERALGYGFDYLKARGVDTRKILTSKKSGPIISELNSNLSKKDYELVFYFAQSWGSLINLQRTDISLMADLNKVASVMDWVCEKDPKIAFDGCLLYHGTFEATKPALLGGDVEKAKKYFRKFIRKNPQNLLGRVQFLQYLIIPHMMEEEYESIMEDLEKEFHTFNQRNIFDRIKGKKESHKSVYNLFNSIAHKRYQVIKKFENDLF